LLFGCFRRLFTTYKLDPGPLEHLDQQEMPQYYKLEIQGIVYLVDPVTTAAYTYDLTNPTMIGHVIWPDASRVPHINLVDGWASILEQKRALHPSS